MPADNKVLRNRLSQSSEINITVTGRKTGRPITIPIWFVLEGDTIYLLPVHGSNTQWYKNALENPSIQLGAKDSSVEFEAIPVMDTSQVSAVVEKFRGKYGAANVKKYYSKLDVVVLAEMK